MLKKLHRLITPAVVEQRSIQLAGKPVTYTLKRTGRRRSIGLRIDDRGLTVNMPLRASEKWLHSVLQEKAVWVVEILESWQAKKPATQHDCVSRRKVYATYHPQPVRCSAAIAWHTTDRSCFPNG